MTSLGVSSTHIASIQVLKACLGCEILSPALKSYEFSKRQQKIAFFLNLKSMLTDGGYGENIDARQPRMTGDSLFSDRQSCLSFCINNFDNRQSVRRNDRSL
jgi:hypothetical protein